VPIKIVLYLILTLFGTLITLLIRKAHTKYSLWRY